ncbi:hypothetical protein METBISCDRAFT_29890 [Metschnikowia bicuspidata]|uniref:Receptor L-domain domain-containing protein n=1 Tax=Metschnikowia bicuspidata TaxID=27322 RepID=A0A4P9ZG60_9ASCO|nr:hypothetical protein METBISCDRAFT_29890 [Metschnikowia bicuspidata]
MRAAAIAVAAFICAVTAEDIPEVCRKGQYSIKCREDLDKIAGCQVLHGTVVVEKFPEPQIDFFSLQKVEGTLCFRDSPSIIRVNIPELTHVYQDLRFERLTSLGIITANKLAHVNMLKLQVLPILTHMEINSINHVRSLTVSDTSLTTFPEICTKEMTDFDVNNNRFMETLIASMETVTNAFQISGNAQNFRVEMRRLRYASNVTVNRVESVRMDNLEEIRNSASFVETQLNKLSLPKLAKIGGSFRLADNRRLTDVNVTSLKDIGGGLLLVNNTLLTKIDQFNNLDVIGGGLEVEGNVSETRWPNLRFIKGAANMTSTNTEYKCSEWLNSEVSRAMRGGVISCGAPNTAVLSRDPTENLSYEERNSSTGSLLRVVLLWPIVAMLFFL